MELSATERQAIDGLLAVAGRLETEVGRVIVGQKNVVRSVLISLVAGGHVLLEGVPGLGKTALVRAVGRALDLSFSRIQFTPDLMPADVVGTNILADGEGGREFRFQPGPIFAHIVLADEVNRATPKTQSALLEAMQEQQATVAGITRRLPIPFFVLATQNPLEMEGTYPLPEAQLDRFFFKVLVPFPTAEELKEIIARTTGNQMAQAHPVATGDDLTALGQLARDVPMAEAVLDYTIRLVQATHPDSPHAPDLVRRNVRYGASPRGLQALVIGGRVRALFEGRYNVAYEDIQQLAAPALRHRIGLSFEGEAQGITTDQVIGQLIEQLRAE